ncbi:MAG: zeta toxin family protein [Bacteroidales bacterium]|nr:zeta toxin family protein [Bacteroidales bacterium]
MTTTDKKMYIIAGCNGVGKTTAFRKKLCEELNNPEFINPDIIAKSIDAEHQWEVRYSAGRETLLTLKSYIERGHSFCIETTLTTRSYAGMIRDAQAKGYKVHLYYYGNYILVVPPNNFS